jgi:hypothetical protein
LLRLLYAILKTHLNHPVKGSKAADAVATTIVRRVVHAEGVSISKKMPDESAWWVFKKT